MERKARHDYVSEVDRACEAEIVREIKRFYPDHAFLCEESAARPATASRLGHRSAGRHQQLPARHPAFRRLDRLPAEGPHRTRGGLRPDARRAVHRQPRFRRFAEPETDPGLGPQGPRRRRAGHGLPVPAAEADAEILARVPGGVVQRRGLPPRRHRQPRPGLDRGRTPGRLLRDRAPPLGRGGRRADRARGRRRGDGFRRQRRRRGQRFGHRRALQGHDPAAAADRRQVVEPQWSAAASSIRGIAEPLPAKPTSIMHPAQGCESGLRALLLHLQQVELADTQLQAWRRWRRRSTSRYRPRRR